MYMHYLSLSKYLEIYFTENADLSWKVSLASLTNVYINEFSGYPKKYSTTFLIHIQFHNISTHTCVDIAKKNRQNF